VSCLLLCVAAEEVVILDENVLVKTLMCSYMDLGALEPSPTHKLMAFAVDASGYETYNIYIQPIPLGDKTASSTEVPSVHDIKGCMEVLTDCGSEVEW
jgi:protease II